jgi:hypothetical protein
MGIYPPYPYRLPQSDHPSNVNKRKLKGVLESRDGLHN